MQHESAQQPPTRGTVRAARAWCRQRLSKSGIDLAPNEGDWLLAHVLQLPSAAHVHLVPERVLTGAERQNLQQLTERRAADEPLQYVLGTVDFRGLTLDVGPGVLIPRPETEKLVDLALSRYPGHGRICDVCTGTGAIALALGAELPGTPCILGTDLSREAIRYALRNRSATGLGHVQFVLGDLLTPLRRGRVFTLVTANPPYVAPGLYAGLPASVRDHEPRLALYAEDDGTALIRRIAASARAHLAPGGWLVCEISSEQGSAVHELFRARGYTEVAVHRDYAGRDRFAVGKA